MTGAVTLREMTAADLPAVLDLEHALFGDEAWTEGMLASELAGVASGRYYLVAEDGGELAGYAGLLTPGGGQADVLTLAVAEPRQGQGLGAALLDALLAEAGRRGCTRGVPRSAGGQHRAQRLYQRRGFRGDRRPARLLPAIGHRCPGHAAEPGPAGPRRAPARGTPAHGTPTHDQAGRRPAGWGAR